MIRIIIVVVFALTSPVQAQEEGAETPRIVVRIELGATANFDGVTVEFSEVLEDSRCPTNVTCVWEGRAKVKVLVTEEGMETVERVVIFGKVMGNESGDRVLCERNEFSVEAKQLVPYPMDPGKQLDYILLVDKRVKN